jgi:signal peptidase I
MNEPKPQLIADETVVPQPARARSRNRRQLRLLLFVLVWSGISYFLITHFLLMGVEIKGASMSPTLRDGERYLLYRCTYLLRTPRKGEIVVIEDPEDHGLSVKRIVGLPEETVEMRTDGLYINNEKAPEPYLLSKYTLRPHYHPTEAVRLASNQYFVMGDNRNRSADSRVYGPVARNQILGVIDK